MTVQFTPRAVPASPSPSPITSPATVPHRQPTQPPSAPPTVITHPVTVTQNITDEQLDRIRSYLASDTNSYLQPLQSQVALLTANLSTLEQRIGNNTAGAAAANISIGSFNKQIVTEALTTQALTVSGTATLANLTVSGTTTLANLNVTTLSTSSNGIFAGTGSSSFAGSLDITKGLRFGNLTQTGSGVNYFSGNVGIGTTNPTTKFQVIGSASISANFEVGGTASVSDLITKGPTVDVRAYGAKGNGIADDTAAVQAALSSSSPAGTLDTPTGGISVMFPCGTYKLTSTLIIKSLTQLIGLGRGCTILDFSSLSSGAALNATTLAATGRVMDIEFRDMKLIGPGRTAGHDGLSITDIALNINFYNVWLYGFRDAIRLTAETGFGFHNSRVSESRIGISIDAPGTLSTASTFDGNWYIDQNEQGFYCSRCQTFKLIGGVFENNTRATSLPQGNAAIVWEGMQSAMVVDVHFEANPVDVILDDDGGTRKSEANLFEGNMFGPTGNVTNIVLISAKQNIFRDNYLNTDGQLYFQIYDTDSAGNQIIGTTFKNNNWQYENQVGAITTYPNSGENSLEIKSYLSAFNVINGSFKATHTNANVPALVGNVPGEAANRFDVLVSGKYEWGDGTNAFDTNLYRSAANTLKTDGIFNVTGNVSITSELAVGGPANFGSTATVSYSRFGSSATTHGLSVSNDVLINGKLEVDGSAYFDGTTNFIGIASSSLFYAGNGTAASPSFSFRADQDTGMFHSALNQLGFSTLGLERLTIDPTGNVGIGTTSPGALLETRSTGVDSSVNLTLSDSGITDHGMTDIMGTDTFLKVIRSSNVSGGARIYGASSGNFSGLTLNGIIGLADPTDTVAAFSMVGSKKSGTGHTYIGSLETVFQVVNYGNILETILGNGNVGLGTANVDAAFELTSAATTTNVASISATALTTGAALSIRVPASTSFFGPILVATDTNGVVLASLSSGGRFSIRRTMFSHGADTTNCTGVGVPSSGCIDYAESMPTDDPTIEAGDIIAVSETSQSGSGDTLKVVKSQTTGDGSVLGIVSTNPAALITGNTVKLGDEANHYHQDGFVSVALAGRVPVKTSLENGPIQPGDKLTASSVPGIAMKATQPGQIIGTALESLNTITAGSYQKIMVFVNVGYWAPSVDSVLASAASSSTPFSLLNDSSFIDQLFNLIIGKFQSMMNITFHNGLIETVKGIFQTVEVQRGITTYDRTTGQPYCIGVDNGQTITTSGACDTASPTPTPTPNVGGTESSILDLPASSSDEGQIGTTPSPTPTSEPSASPTPEPSPSPTPTP